jgi:hypothetical protein
VPSPDQVDVLVVSLGSTGGLRAADAELAESIRRAGASAALTGAPVPPAHPPRTLALIDLYWALAVRRAARAEIARRAPRAIIYSSTTAALLWSRPGAIRFDAPSAGNRPGRHGLWQRPLERRRLRESPLLLPWSEGGLRETPPATRGRDRTLVLPVPVEPSAAGAARAPGAPVRDIAAITYAANPAKKGLDRVLSAWRRLQTGRRSATSERLVVTGVTEQELTRAGLLGEMEANVEVAGALSRDDYRALVRRSRVFVCAPRREDYGLAQLESLADGCMLVTSPAPGPYVALPLARTLDPRLVGEHLEAALRTALDEPVADYATRALQAVQPFRRESVDRLVADELLPRMLA